MLTAKQAIKGKCADCYGRTCTATECALFGLSKPQQGANRTAAIRNYCRWCMAGENIKQCSCVDCTIYGYRAAVTGRLNVRFLPLKMPIEGNGGTSTSKDVSNYTGGKTPPKNGVNHAKAVL